MKIYAEPVGRRIRQIAADLLFVAWIVGCVQVAGIVHDRTLALQEPGRKMESSAVALADNLTTAGNLLTQVPLVGSDVAEPFDKASEASMSLAAAGRKQVTVAGTLAAWLQWIVGLFPALIAAGFYLPPRIRFIRRATATARYVADRDELDLLALRALATAPADRLARIHPNAAGAWRVRDPQVLAALADLELRASGLNPRASADLAEPGPATA